MNYFFNFLRIDPINQLNLRSGTSPDQWWQLFDPKTKKFYYFNPHENKTTWHRPTGGGPTSPGNISLVKSENGSNGHNKENNRGGPIIIPLASKLIERINSNIGVMKRSKRFLKVMKKKLDSDLSYDLNDLSIISELTERLFNIQDILLEDEEPCSMLDLSSLEISSQDLQIASTSSNSFTSLVSSNSFQSLELEAKTKRRLQPRTNPNYVNVDFIDSKNGSLIKNTYVKLQDLTNESTVSSSSSSIVVEAKPRNGKHCRKRSATLFTEPDHQLQNNPSFTNLSQSILLLISLLNTTKKKNILKSKSKTILTSSSTSMNTLCSRGETKVNTPNNGGTLLKQSYLGDEKNSVSLCSSSATLINENMNNINKIKAKGYGVDSFTEASLSMRHVPDSNSNLITSKF